MISSTEAANLIMFFPALRSLPDPLLAELQAQAETISAHQDEILLDEAAACRGFLLVTDGTVAAYRRSDNGRRLLVCRVGPGEACAITVGAMLGQRVDKLCAVAESAVSGVCFPQPLFFKLLDQSLGFRSFVFSVFARCLCESLGLLGLLAFGGLEERLACSLLRRRYPIRVSHKELADELGTAREQISRILKCLEQRNILQLRRRNIYVTNESALRNIAEGRDANHPIGASRSSGPSHSERSVS